jgi:plasmid replication initiation protein
MEKLYRRKIPKVYKNKKLNSANFGTYNLNDYQVFLQLISMIGGVDEAGKYLQPQELQREYTLTAKEFSQQFGVELDGAYTTLKRVAKKLTETSITLEKPELFETWHIALCAEAKYNHKQGSLTIEFTPNIMPYLAQVKQKFILYNLKEIANFGSLYSTRLYELIQEFKDTGYIIKSVAQLRETFAVGKKFKLYNDFKRFTFAHAVEEINSQYEMNLRFEELKEGRKVVGIRFEFTPSRTSQGYNPATKQLVNTIVKPKRKIKRTDDQTPQPVNPDQQELPITSTDRYDRGDDIDAVKAVEQFLEQDIIKAEKMEKDFAILNKAEEAMQIIHAFMEEGLTETQAKVKAIKLKLI